jgi:hypothetical protein
MVIHKRDDYIGLFNAIHGDTHFSLCGRRLLNLNIDIGRNDAGFQAAAGFFL